MNLIVQKYGGSSLKTPEAIRNVAKRIAQLRQSGKQVIVVVSAMGSATDDLLDLAYLVSSRPNRRELDMLLTTGERVSMALMSMALHDLGCPSISLTGSQAGVFTDSSHSNARICDVKPIRVAENLAQGKVVVLAGFQGVDPISKEITTLGRGGSDTTAVAMAAHFQAQRCEMLKDVDGIYSADPKILGGTIRYSEFPILALEESCFWGSKILHYRSAELARILSVPLYIGSSVNPDKGTIILNKDKDSGMYEKSKPLAVNVLNEVHHLAVNCKHPDEELACLEKILIDNQLAWPQILASVYENSEWRAMIASSEEQIKALKSALQGTEIRCIKETLCGITLTCQGSYSSDLPKKIMACLKKAEIFPHKSLHTGDSISVFVTPEFRDKTVQALHQLI
ncbi:MAG: aspartate kinase [Bdellovibrionales bacterium]|nr:aspartate kinase [Bdellovibrionales bacterium]